MVELYRPPPAEHNYESYLPGKYIGYTVVGYFAERFPYMNREEWQERIEDGRITVNGEQVAPTAILKQHDFIETRMGLREEPLADRTLDVVYEDESIRVFNKGTPLPVHPSGRYFKNSMTELLKEVYPDETPRPVQRLDALTTGLVVFAKSKQVATHLMLEFSANRVAKEYLVLVEGVPSQKNFVVDRAVGKIKGGAREVAGPETLNPKSAVTHFECLSTLNGRSLIRAVPHSGRTNQIRVHLASVGLPVINDPVYGTGTEEAPRFGLHAHRLRFNGMEGEVALEAPWPEHFQPYCDAVVE